MKLHVYNLNINNDFINEIYVNSMHVFLSGFIGQATHKCNIELYGSIKTDRKVFYSGFMSYLRSKFFLIDVYSNRSKKSILDKEEDLVVVFGYNPLVVIQLIILKFFGFKTICYIFDTHKLNFYENKSKKYLIDIYYRIGLYLAKFIDIVVCVNSNFKKKYNKNFPKIIESKIGYSCGNLEFNFIGRNVLKSNCLNILYGGTLNEDNGAHLILDLVRKNFPFDINFIVYGYGDLSDKFERENGVNEHLEFIGRQPNLNVKYLIKYSDICIHLRDPKSVNKDIAFPSKLIEYFFNSESTLSNDFPALNDTMKQAMLSVCDFSVEGLYKSLLDIEKEGNLLIENREILNALKKVRYEHDWQNVFNEFYENVS